MTAADETERQVLEAVRGGYSFDGPCLELGATLAGGTVHADAPVRVPLAMLNRHGLVAGATGTGKTKTLQLMAEQCSAAGIPVFAADIKGDLSGLAAPGEPSARVQERAAQVGQDWSASGCPVELLALGGEGDGVPVRATITSFGPALLAKVLDLNDTQESSLGLVFHYADRAGLPLLDLADLRAVVQHLLSDEGKAELKGLGGLASSTAGVILRRLVAFEDQGAEEFFGEPEFDVGDLLRTADDGRGVVSLLELPRLQDRPEVFSTFLMWLLAELFEELPEAGDLDQPKLVFFFDEAHLLFTDARKGFLDAIGQTVRLIRSKGVGVFFVTQTPQDVPDGVLAQLGNRVQHALRAFTPADAKALRATVETFPRTAYDLAEVLTGAGTGEAVVTVLSDRGAPTPVAWTLLRAPRSLMAPAPPAVLASLVAASPLRARYGAQVDRESARELLAERLRGSVPGGAGAGTAAPGGRDGAAGRGAPVDTRTEEQRLEDEILGRSPRLDLPDATTVANRRSEPVGDAGGMMDNPLVTSALRAAGTVIGREIVRGIFGTRRRRSRR